MLCAIDARSIDRLKSQYCYPITLKFRNTNIEQIVSTDIIIYHNNRYTRCVTLAPPSYSKILITIIPKLIGIICYAVQQSARPDALHLHDVYGVHIFGYHRRSRDNSTTVSILFLRHHVIKTVIYRFQANNIVILVTTDTFLHVLNTLRLLIVFGTLACLLMLSVFHFS